MQLANVLPFPKPKPVEALSRAPYVIRHEDKLEVAMLAGRRIMRIRKTFFDGSDRVELSLERELSATESMDAILDDLEAAVEAYFDA